MNPRPTDIFTARQLNPTTIKTLCSRAAFVCRRAWGWLLNFFLIPGFIRECEYQSSISNDHIKVRISPLFTIITVNHLDIYFYRTSGHIDGIGFASKPDKKPKAWAPIRRTENPDEAA